MRLCIILSLLRQGKIKFPGSRAYPLSNEGKSVTLEVFFALKKIIDFINTQKEIGYGKEITCI